MPIYCYKCPKCGEHTEIFQRTENTGKIYLCETCGEALEKIIAPVSVIFKGSGFYINDYAHGNNSSSKPAEHDKKNLKVDSSSNNQSASSPTAASSGSQSSAPKSAEKSAACA